MIMLLIITLKDLNSTLQEALLINADKIPLSSGKHYSEVFPDNHIDLSLRNREARNIS